MWNLDKERSSDMDFNTHEGGKMIAIGPLILILVLQVMQIDAGAYCEYDYSLFITSTTYCVYGCCGTKYSDYNTVCCSYSSASIEVPVGVIVGSVIGGLAGLAILIGFIVCCCVTANNSNRRTGTVIQPANTNMQTFLVNSTASSQVQTSVPVQQGAIGYGCPSGGQQPQYVLPNIVNQGYANAANLPPTTARY